MACHKPLFRCFFCIATIAHNNSVIFRPKLSKRHWFTLFMKSESKSIHDVDICKVKLVQFLNCVKKRFPKIRIAHIVEQPLGESRTPTRCDGQIFKTAAITSFKKRNLFSRLPP